MTDGRVWTQPLPSRRNLWKIRRLRNNPELEADNTTKSSMCLDELEVELLKILRELRLDNQVVNEEVVQEQAQHEEKDDELRGPAPVQEYRLTRRYSTGSAGHSKPDTPLSARDRKSWNVVPTV